jgi:hypothetical protein
MDELYKNILKLVSAHLVKYVGVGLLVGAILTHNVLIGFTAIITIGGGAYLETIFELKKND